MGMQSACRVSSICSDYYHWFVELGYPELDIAAYPDGSWDIIQYERVPLIPAEARFRTVLGPMEHVEISKGFCETWCRKLDLTRREYWAQEENKSRKIEEEAEATELHAEDLAHRDTEAVTRNPALMERIAENGIQEMNLNRIAKHIPTHELRSLHKP